MLVYCFYGPAGLVLTQVPAFYNREAASIDFGWRPRSARTVWVLAAILALLFHVLLLTPKIPGLLFNSSALTPPRVDIKHVDPRKLEAIRKQWRQREKQLLLDKNLKAPTADEAPTDARYMSDRNIRVDKETRAKHATAMPKAGAPGEPRAPTQPRPRERERSRIPELGNLGVKLPAAPKETPPPRQAAASGAQDGGAQALRDPTLPESGENMLNAQESVYYSFYARVYEAVVPVWQSSVRAAARSIRLQPGEYTTRVDVVLDAHGNLVGVQEISGSGILAFDEAVQTAWRKLQRFPNPPGDLLNEQGQVHTGWSFTVQLNQGLNLEILPPERAY